jgi:hypothetical protein
VRSIARQILLRRSLAKKGQYHIDRSCLMSVMSSSLLLTRTARGLTWWSLLARRGTNVEAAVRAAGLNTPADDLLVNHKVSMS